MDSRTPRRPTIHEIRDIAEWLAKQEGEEKATRDHIDTASNAFISVFDSYISDSPGYTGRVMVCVWPGAPELVSVFVDKTQIAAVKIDSATIGEEGG